MAKQPINPNTNIESQFSIELNDIIKNINDIYIQSYPAQYISTNLFLVAAIENTYTMLYKCLNSIIPITIINKIRDELSEELTSTISGNAPTGKLTMSQELMTRVKEARKLMATYSSETITSDLVLVTICKSEDSIRAKFEKHDVSLKTIESSAKALHEITATFNGIFGGIPTDLSGLEFVKIIDDDQSRTQHKQSKGAIDSYCINLNEIAKQGKIDDLVGRDEEISLLVNILNRRKCNNAVIVSQSGVGKTHLIEGLAKSIVEGTSPLALKDKVIYRFNMSEITSGTQYRGVFESRVSSLMKELQSQRNAILFFDDMHTALSDKNKNDYDIMGLMNELFCNNDVQVIATTTPSGYKNYFARNGSFARKFQRLDLLPPSIDDCMHILHTLRPTYDAFHKVKYDDEAIKMCVQLSKRYITDRNMPSSAIDILDESGAFKKISSRDSEELRLANATLRKLMKTKEELSVSNNVEESENVDELINATRLNISDIDSKLKNSKNIPVVTADDICLTISKHTNIPVSRVNKSEIKSLSKISEILKEHIVGQDEAIDKITRAIKRSKIGLCDTSKPVGSFLCIGNSGVGKTLMAKKLAEEIYGSEKCLVRFDMSEYADKTSVNKLIGASAGYVGYDNGGLLTEAIKNKKYCVLLIDEIEKANEEVFNLFLQILDEGFLTDNEGNKVDFKNTIIILTSNVGTKRASSEKAVGFNSDNSANEKGIITKEMKNKFPPEFLNRLTDIVYFNKLTDDNLKRIIEIELGKLKDKLTDLGYTIESDNLVIDYLFNKMNKDNCYGARPISRIIQSEIENKICDLIVECENSSMNFNITIENDNLLITK